MRKRIRKVGREIRRLRHRARRLGENHHLRRWRKTKHEIVKKQMEIERVKERNREGVDCSYGRPDPLLLKNAGKDFICLYLNSIPGFGMTKSDIRRYSEHEIDLVAIFEHGIEDARRGYAVGVRHAKETLDHARALDIPHGRPVFFAADYEAKGPEAVHYFIGVHDTLKANKFAITPGAYGDIALIAYLFEHNLIHFGFQTYAWSHHVWSDRAHLRQVLIDLPGAELFIGGSTVDYCKSTAVDFGQWRISVAKPLRHDEVRPHRGGPKG